MRGMTDENAKLRDALIILNQEDEIKRLRREVEWLRTTCDWAMRVISSMVEVLTDDEREKARGGTDGDSSC
jgi:hypothetical protein